MLRINGLRDEWQMYNMSRWKRGWTPTIHSTVQFRNQENIRQGKCPPNKPTRNPTKNITINNG